MLRRKSAEDGMDLITDLVSLFKSVVFESPSYIMVPKIPPNGQRIADLGQNRIFFLKHFNSLINTFLKLYWNIFNVVIHLG